MLASPPMRCRPFNMFTYKVCIFGSVCWTLNEELTLVKVRYIGYEAMHACLNAGYSSFYRLVLAPSLIDGRRHAGKLPNRRY